MMRAILLPRIWAISCSEIWTMSSPSRTIDPETMRPGGIGISLMSESIVTDLPQPDSPTIPRVSPRRRSKDIPSTALTVPQRVVKCVLRFSTAKTVSVFILVSVVAIKYSSP